MDRATAKTRLQAMLAWQARPVLTDAQVEALLDMSREPDSSGLTVDEPTWVPTWNLNIGAAEGWRWKAAAAAGDYSFSADGASYNKADVLAHCLEMVDTYAAKLSGTVLVGGSTVIGYDTSEQLP